MSAKNQKLDSLRAFVSLRQKPSTFRDTHVVYYAITCEIPAQICLFGLLLRCSLDAAAWATEKNTALRDMGLSNKRTHYLKPEYWTVLDC